jgi:hypothetical protein
MDKRQTTELAGAAMLALLDLPPECMEALAFLDASFPAGSALPEQAHIRALLDRVLRLLPASARHSTSASARRCA